MRRLFPGNALLWSRLNRLAGILLIFAHDLATTYLPWTSTSLLDRFCLQNQCRICEPRMSEHQAGAQAWILTKLKGDGELKHFGWMWKLMMLGRSLRGWLCVRGCRKVCHKYAFRRGWSRVHLPDKTMGSCGRQALDHEFEPMSVRNNRADRFSSVLRRWNTLQNSKAAWGREQKWYLKVTRWEPFSDRQQGPYHDQDFQIMDHEHERCSEPSSKIGNTWVHITKAQRKTKSSSKRKNTCIDKNTM